MELVRLFSSESSSSKQEQVIVVIVVRLLDVLRHRELADAAERSPLLSAALPAGVPRLRQQESIVKPIRRRLGLLQLARPLPLPLPLPPPLLPLLLPLLLLLVLILHDEKPTTTTTNR